LIIIDPPLAFAEICLRCFSRKGETALAERSWPPPGLKGITQVIFFAGKTSSAPDAPEKRKNIDPTSPKNFKTVLLLEPFNNIVSMAASFLKCLILMD
jgi:hypothetical protein